MRQLGCQMSERRREGLPGFPAGARDSGGAVGQQQYGVASAGIAVNGNAVETVVNRGYKQRAQGSGRNQRVGGQYREHGSHFRVNHARAFDDSADRNAAGGQLDLGGQMLRPRVSGHDGSCGCHAPIGMLVCRRRGQSGSDFVHRQLHPDDAGREYQNLLYPAAHSGGCQRLHVARVLQTGRAGAHVGDARVRSDSAHAVAVSGQGLPIEGDRSAHHLIAGEHTCGRAIAL